MTEQTRAVFENPQLLREKLLVYLQTPEKVEIYAQAAEKFFNTGGRISLKFTPTWSWWGFIGTIWFLFYRKLNMHGLGFFIALVLTSFVPLLPTIIMIAIPIAGKYFVIKRFEQALDMNNDMIFVQMSGVAKWAIYVAIALSVIGVIVSIAMFSFFGALMSDLNSVDAY